ncbi:MAG TPA: hypothetical protein VN622_02975 [Clostridia bacterium]|nr:hypothetical protein [Clostridia bacterium]
MWKALIAIALTVSCAALFACKSSPAPQSSTESTTAPAASNLPSDEMTEQLRKLAGTGASDCGRVPVNGDVKAASDCAMQANSANKPFTVRYDLPMEKTFSIATVRAADGKLYTVQYDSRGWEAKPENGTITEDKKVLISECQKELPLRIAGSGRITCMAPQQMPAGGGMSPHGGMSPSGANTKGAMPQMANPHGTASPATAPSRAH